MAHLLIWGHARTMLAGTHVVRHWEEVHTLGALKAALDGTKTALVLANVDRLESEPEKTADWARGAGKNQAVIVAVADASDAEGILERFPWLDDVVTPPLTARRLNRMLERALDSIRNKRVITQLENALIRRGDELSELNEIGVKLSSERDIDTLLELVLEKSRRVTRADAGSLYIVERAPLERALLEEVDRPEKETGERRSDQLRFELAQNDSVDVPFVKSTVRLERSDRDVAVEGPYASIAGYVAVKGETVNIPDAYAIASDAPYQISRSFDEQSHYRTKSMLVLPMRDHNNEVIGVVQLINKKRDADVVLKPLDLPEAVEEMVQEEVIPFTSGDEALIESLASQAAVAYRNAALLKNIRELFENFVTAAVTAIEKRDPTTSGHSERVAILTVDLAKNVNNVSSGILADVTFTREQVEEIRYASKLHDFGKVGVPEKILKKENKLLASELKAIETRLAYRARMLEAQHLRQKLEGIDSRRLTAEEIAALDARYADECREIQRVLELVRLANEPRIEEDRGIEEVEAMFDALQALPVRGFDRDWKREQELSLDEWTTGPYLSERERSALLIRRGSLTDDERYDLREGINSHVQHTYEFLRQIPWTGELRRIPEIAWAHHEKLDGSGYPRKLTSEKIPLQSKMMTVSDIFDALRAWDRPYKRAVSPERALDILQDDVKRGQLDGDLVTIFIESKLWNSERYLSELNGGQRRKTQS